MKNHTITPVERHGGYYVKRDDLYEFGGVNGGKVRTIHAVATAGGLAGGLISSGPRGGSQNLITARVGAALGIPVRCHIPRGKTTPETEDIIEHGAEVIRHPVGYQNVISARAVADAKELGAGWRLVPGMLATPLNIKATARQVKGTPAGVRRIVVPVGSGMSLAGVLHGVRGLGLDIPVVGVRVGSDPTKRLNAFAPFGWRRMMDMVDVTNEIEYGKATPGRVGSLELDGHYEAKVLPYIKPGDMIWVVGYRFWKEHK